MRKSEDRRRRREREVVVERNEGAAMNEELTGVLDEALGRLGEKERQAILVRYLERKSVAETGEILGVSVSIVEKRLKRGIAGIRRVFARKGFLLVPMGVVGAMMMAEGAKAAPAGLAASAVGVTTQASASVVKIAKGASMMMKMAVVKMIAVAAVVVVMAFIGAVGCVQVMMHTGNSDRGAAEASVESGPSDESKVTADMLARALRANWEAIVSYQGKCRQTMYIYAPYDWEGREPVLLSPYDEPRATQIVDVEFKHDVHKDDYWAKMHFLSRETHPIVIERRYGQITEALLCDASGEPVSGTMRDAPGMSEYLYMGHRARNFITRDSVFVLTSESRDGEVKIPLFELLRDPARVKIYDEEVEVEGYRCVKVTLLSPTTHDMECTRISFVYLARELGFSIVRSQASLLSGREDFNTLAAVTEGRLDEYLDYMEARTQSLMVNSNYREVRPGVWIPMTVVSYMLPNLWPGSIAEGADVQSLEKLKDRNEATRHLKNTIVQGYVEFTLDAETLVLNERIPREVFAKSVIPAGVPVDDLTKEKGTSCD